MNNVKYKILFSIILIVFLLFLFVIFKIFFLNHNFIKSIDTSYNGVNKNNQDEKKVVKGTFSYKLFRGANAYLTIPIINLYNIPIKNGTSQEIMKKYIGHFENTSFDTGNIGLASHNRGAGANYFENIYKLNKGDNIFYTYENVVRKYKVNKKVVIDSYDWSNLENTTKNIITLITCIENKPNLRLCIQATQI